MLVYNTVMPSNEERGLRLSDLSAGMWYSYGGAVYERSTGNLLLTYDMRSPQPPPHVHYPICDLAAAAPDLLLALEAVAADTRCMFGLKTTVATRVLSTLASLRPHHRSRSDDDLTPA